MQHTYFVPRNTTKLTTRGGTSPDGVEMTLIRERKSTHRLGTWLPQLPFVASKLHSLKVMSWTNTVPRRFVTVDFGVIHCMVTSHIRDTGVSQRSPYNST